VTSHFLTTGDASFIGTTILDGGGGAFVIAIPADAEDRPTIQGFTIQNSEDGILPNAMFNLLDCLVRDTKDGVDYEDGSGGLIQFCTFELNGDDGIDLDNDVDIVIADNIIRNNNDDGIEIRMQGYTGPTLNITITRNEIYGNAEDGIQLIHYDVVTDRFFEITENLIYNNLLAGIGMMNGAITDEDFRAADIPETIYIFNNTFANNSHGITGGDNMVVLDNIFVDHSVIAVKNVDANSELAYNLFFNNGIDNSGSNVDVGTSVFTDPRLDAGLVPLPGSSVIDAGTAFYSWQGTTVLDLPPGAFSGAAPDIGAFEFDSASGPAPDPPIPVAPADGAVDLGLTPTLQWSGAGDNFSVEVASDAAFGNLVDSAVVSTTQYTVAVGALDYLTTYYWRVNASNASGTSDFSTAHSFTTTASSAPPDPPVLLLPNQGALDVPLQGTLEWTGTADDFDVEVATDPGFLNVVFSSNTVSSTITLPAGALLHATDYYWHVRGNNSFGSGNFSNAFVFTTVAPPDTIPPSQPQNLRSPAQFPTTINLLWDAAADNVGVSFYNIYRDGVVVASESSTNHTAVGLTPSTRYDFQVSAVDAAGNESLLSENLAVAAANDPPVANDDDFTSTPVAEGETLTGLDVLANDTDADGTLSVAAVTIKDATNGVATVNADGTVDFTHDGSETTVASFIYTVNDNDGAPSNAATVSLAVAAANDPPVANNVAITGTMQVGQVLIGNYTYADAEGDVEGSSTYQWLRGPTPISGATAPTYTLVAADQGTSIVFEVTPVAVTGASPGATVASPAVGPVVAAPNSVQVLTPAGSSGYRTYGGSDQDKHLEVTVTLVDGTGAPVASATVSVTISGPQTGGGTATTDASGQVVFKITNAPSGTYTTTVIDVTATGRTWDGITPPNSFNK
jgi:hypothetical protein